MRARQPARGETVGARVNAELFCRASENLQRVFGLVAIFGLAGIGVQAQQGDCGTGIARGSRCVLERLAPRRQSSQLQPLFEWRLSIEEAAGCRVGEAADHLVGDLPGEAEVTEVAGDFV